MEQLIEVKDGGRVYYVSWRGHTVKLDESAKAWVRSQAIKTLTKVRDEFCRKHVCEECNSKMRPNMTADQLRAHAVRMFAHRWGGKSIGSF